MYNVLLLTTLLIFIIFIYTILISSYKEEFITNGVISTSLYRPFFTIDSYYSKLLKLDKKIDLLELKIKNKKQEDLTTKLYLLHQKYKWMLKYHKTIVDPNSAARKNQNDVAKKKMRSAFANSQKNALNDFKKKNKSAFEKALREGKPLPRATINLSSSASKIINKYSEPGSGSKSKKRAKNAAIKNLRKSENGLWQPFKAIEKIINDGKIANMKSDFKKNDNAKSSTGNYQFGKPEEGSDIANSEFPGSYS